VNGQTGSVWPQVRANATMGTVRPVPLRALQLCSARADLLPPRLQNITVTLSGPIPFGGAVLTSFQFSNRPGANLWTSTGVAKAYNCATQVGVLGSVTPGTLTVRASAAPRLQAAVWPAEKTEAKHALESRALGPGLTRRTLRRTPLRTPARRSRRSRRRFCWRTTRRARRSSGSCSRR
jgi:hypothetical protein